MKLVAACNLRWGSGKPIDLNKEVVSLDTYTDGQVPEGTYVLAGQQVILGRVVLTDQPDLPDVIFYPSWKRSRTSPLFLEAIAEGITFSDQDRNRLHVDERLQEHECSQAQMKFRLHGLEVVFGENEALALGTEILQLSPYRDCPKTGSVKRITRKTRVQPELPQPTHLRLTAVPQRTERDR
jgi:hypothetical protein